MYNMRFFMEGESGVEQGQPGMELILRRLLRIQFFGFLCVRDTKII